MTAYKTLTASLARTCLRDPVTLFFSFIFPPALLLVLALSMGDLPGMDGHALVDTIGPNVMGFGIAFVGMFAGAMNIAEWREKGVMRVLRSAPMSAGSILGSALTVAVVTALIQAALVVAVGLVPAVGVHLSVWAGLSIVPVFLGTLFFYSLGVLVGLAVPTVSAVSLVVTIVVMPMGFASGAMMPLEILPSWVQTLSHVLPLTYLLDVLRWSLTGVAELSDALLGCGITAAAGASSARRRTYPPVLVRVRLRPPASVRPLPSAGRSPHGLRARLRPSVFVRSRRPASRAPSARRSRGMRATGARQWGRDRRDGSASADRHGLRVARPSRYRLAR